MKIPKPAAGIFLLTFLFLQTAFAQDGVRVKVSLDDEPLGFATVSVNGKPYAAADKDGILLITGLTLRDGDTVSATMSGLREGSAVYKAGQQELAIRISSNININDVVVTASGSTRRYFRKRIKLRPTGFDFAEHRYGFTLAYGNNYSLKGHFAWAQLPEYYRKTTGETGVSTVPDTDIGGFYQDLDSILVAVHRASLVSIPSASDIVDEGFLALSDNGLVDGSREFVINSKPSVEGYAKGTRSLRARLRVNPATNQIVSSNTYVTANDGRSMEVETRYEYDNEYKVIHPMHITATVTAPPTAGGDSVYTVSMDKKVLKKYPRTLFAKDVKRSTFRITQNERRYNSMMKNYIYGK